MINTFRPLFYTGIVLMTLLLAGCSGTPTRQLVSDVCMIKVGETGRQEVLNLMGDPDTTRMVTDSVEEWVYYEEDKAFMQGIPLVGGAFDSNGYNMVVITLSGDTVATCRYSGYEEDEFDWQDDYSWQETEKK